MDGRRNPFLPQAKLEAAPPQPAFGQQPGSLSFGQYMASKIQKLRSQNDGIKKSSRLFDGVAIYVNGQTEPRKEVLRTLILEHGGQFEAYMTSRVTHMIAEQLADSKLREIMKMKKPLPVVHPKWIVDSIAAGKRVAMHSYIYSRFHDPLQPSFAISAAPAARPNDQGARVVVDSPMEVATDCTPIPRPAPPHAVPNEQKQVAVNTNNAPIPRAHPKATLGLTAPESARQEVAHDNQPRPLHQPPVLPNAGSFKWPSAFAVAAVPSKPPSVVPPTDTAAPRPTNHHSQPAMIDHAPSHPPTNERRHASSSLPKQSQVKKQPTPLFNTTPAPLSFGQYMTSKIAKLRHQNDLSIQAKQTSRVLAGVAIYVNGQTSPSKEVLKALVLQHGGAFESYLTAQVTHMIATHLSTSKRLELEYDATSTSYDSPPRRSRKKKPLPVVHPQWIVDSVAQQKRLPLRSYMSETYQATSLQPTPSGTLVLPPPSSHCVRPSPQAENVSYTATTRVPTPAQTFAKEMSLRIDIPAQGMECGDEQNPTQRSTSSTSTQILGESPVIRDDTTSPFNVGGFDGGVDLPTTLSLPSPPLELSPASTMKLSQLSTHSLESLDIPATQVLTYSQEGDSLDVNDTAASTPVAAMIQDDVDLMDAGGLEEDDVVPSQVSPIEVPLSRSAPKEPCPPLPPTGSSAMEEPLGSIHADVAMGTPDLVQSKPAPSDNTASALRPIKSTRDGAAAFVRSFFANSRLHHIGSWKSFYKEHIGEFTTESRVAVKDCVFGSCAKDDRVILHVDMDCFFVSVVIRDMPSVYQTLPVAVAHSGYSSHTTTTAAHSTEHQSKRGTSEISSCNYVARAYGLKAGMYMETAKARCPNLIVLPYNFGEIEAVSCQVYKIFHRFTPAVQAMSCDEAYLEFPKGTNGMDVARQIRRAIFNATKCHASVGVSYNILLARLATKQAKPNNAFEITPATAASHIDGLPVSELPGVGHVMHAKLADLNIHTCADLKAWSEAALSPHFGAKTSEMLQRFARGSDTRPLELAPVVKSISADVNYGVRLADAAAATEFIQALSAEVCDRLVKRGFVASALTLKLKIRRPDAPVEPTKFMGHGPTDDCSKSIRLHAPTQDAAVIESTCVSLLKQLHAVAQDIRGAGIQATRLAPAQPSLPDKKDIPLYFKATDATDAAKPPLSASSVTKGAPIPPAPRPTRRPDASDATEPPAKKRKPSSAAWSVPSLSQIDPDVLHTLPEAMQREILLQVAPPTVPTSYSQIDQSVLHALPKQLQQEIHQQFPKKLHLRPSVTGQTKGKQPIKHRHQPPLHPTASMATVPEEPTLAPGLPPPSQLDPTVWAALPPSIQSELLAQPAEARHKITPLEGKAGDHPSSRLPDLSLDTAVPWLLAKIRQFSLADVGPVLRRLKRRHGGDDPRRFNDVLARVNGHLKETYGHGLSEVIVAPFDT